MNEKDEALKSFGEVVQDLLNSMFLMVISLDKVSERFSRRAAEADDHQTRMHNTNTAFDLIQTSLQLESARNQLAKMACRLGFMSLKGTQGTRLVELETEVEEP